MNIKVGDQFEIDGEYTVKGFLLDGGKLPDELAALGVGATLEFNYSGPFAKSPVSIELAALRNDAQPRDGDFSLDNFQALDIRVMRSTHQRFVDAEGSMNLKFTVRGK